jgi:hypothetical protein
MNNWIYLYNQFAAEMFNEQKIGLFFLLSHLL